MNITNGMDNILYNLGQHQDNLSSLTSKLSSGLRIENAADDPSGLAISESLQTRVSGLQQAVENVQTGGNLLAVADGAAAQIQQILQRVNSLVIESNSDINSNEQLSAIQTEIDQMLKEINHISSSANFNGVKLFDGSHDTYVAAPNAPVVVQLINPGQAPDGNAATPDVANSQLSSPLMFDPNSQTIEAPGQHFTGVFVFKLENYDAATGSLTFEQDMYSTDPSFANNGTESIQVQPGVPVNAGPNLGGGGSPVNISMPSGYGLTVNLANLSPQDAGGVAEGIFILDPRATGGGTAININDSGTEGGTVAISLPTLSTNALQVSDISVLRPTMVDQFDNTQGVDSSNQWAAMDAQLRVQNALDQISQVRAQIGAQMVSTQEDSNSDNVAAVNLTSSESSIRDLNVGSAVTAFTREQILTQVATSVLSQYELDSREVAALMIQALIA